MNAGQMDQLVTLQAYGAGEDALGQPLQAWADVATVWAQAQPMRGRDYLAAAAINSEASVRFRVRYRDDVTSAMRVLWRGVAHAIVAPPVDVNGGRHTLELMCAAGAAV